MHRARPTMVTLWSVAMEDEKNATDSVIEAIFTIGRELKDGKNLTIIDMMKIFLEHSGEYVKDVKLTGITKASKDTLA